MLWCIAWWVRAWIHGCALRSRWALLAGALALAGAPAVWAAAASAPASGPAGTAPLVLGQRTVFVFRAPLGEFTAQDRAQRARQRVQQAIDGPGGGWTSVHSLGAGTAVDLDGQTLFHVLPGDVPPGSADTTETLANAASRVLQTVWRESRERRDPRANLVALLKLLAALVVLVAALAAVWSGSRHLRDRLGLRLARRVGQALPDAALVSSLTPLLLGLASRSCVLVAWLLSLLAMFVFLAFALDQFALTRALGEGLFHAFATLLLQSLGSMAEALPGLFVAVTIFLVAWICTQVSAELFRHVATGRLKLGMLDAHTAPVTRHIVNASLWLFALAMAYPYLPGAQTEAFKGLSVILGIMVSIGASGLVGQIASGVILVYTRALLLGEYVRIQHSEGTVTEIGLFVTRLRTGLGAEVALPNSLVLGNVTTNFSRARPGPGYLHETAITIGYDTPWRQVQALLVEAARSVPHIATDPAPRVVQTALDDAYVAYRLVVEVTAADPALRGQTASRLHAAILDSFNRYGVQIMSPSYRADPAQPKLVPAADWYAAPARRPDTEPAPAGVSPAVAPPPP